MWLEHGRVGSNQGPPVLWGGLQARAGSVVVPSPDSAHPHGHRLLFSLPVERKLELKELAPASVAP